MAPEAAGWEAGGPLCLGPGAASQGPFTFQKANWQGGAGAGAGHVSLRPVPSSAFGTVMRDWGRRNPPLLLPLPLRPACQAGGAAAGVERPLPGTSGGPG